MSRFVTRSGVIRCYRDSNVAFWYSVISSDGYLASDDPIGNLPGLCTHAGERHAMVGTCRCQGPLFNIKMSSYLYRKSHCGDKTVVRSSYLHNGISYTGKMSSLYWTGAHWWALLAEDISYFPLISQFLILWKTWLFVEDHVQIWQVSPHLTSMGVIQRMRLIFLQIQVCNQ